MTVTHIMESPGPKDDGGEVFHFSIQQDPRGSPVDRDWHGGHYQVGGMKREKIIRVLRALADRFERGENIPEISEP